MQLLMFTSEVPTQILDDSDNENQQSSYTAAVLVQAHC